MTTYPTLSQARLAAAELLDDDHGLAAEVETEIQAAIAEDRDAAIEQAIAEHEATLHVIAELERAPQAFTIEHLVDRLPPFTSAWPRDIVLRWFDSFDHLASLIAKEAQS